MKKALPFFFLAILCAALAFRYYRPDLPSFAEASEDGAGNIADLNQPLPHTVLPAVDGNWVNLESYRGKVVLINFWTTWCPGCRDEMPDLIKLQQKFESSGFTVVALAVDDEGEESVKTFVQTESFSMDGSPMTINFPVLLGSDESARKIGFEGGLPASVLVTATARKSSSFAARFTHKRFRNSSSACSKVRQHMLQVTRPLDLLSLAREARCKLQL